MESDPCRSFSFSVEEREAAEGAGRKRPARWEEPAGGLAGEESARRLYFSRSRAALRMQAKERNKVKGDGRRATRGSAKRGSAKRGSAPERGSDV